MTKTLIAYGTRYGATAKSSEVIEKVLTEKFEHIVTVLDLKKKEDDFDYSSYDNIIIGSSIAMFSWTRTAKKFLANDFVGKNLFVFISSAALTYDAYLKGNMKKYEKWKKRFLDSKVKKRANVKPVSTAVFGGMMQQPDGKITLDNWKEEDIVAWAEEIGNQTS